jgi:hypothetical protein
MGFSLQARCVCGALMITVTASGLAFRHDPHTHTERPSEPTRAVSVAVVSASSTAIPGGVLFDSLFKSTGTA